ncbi:hypothetical protein FG064_16410 [Vibrio cholerae]|nr:hypothetical protein [Vibrio cholerae]
MQDKLIFTKDAPIFMLHTLSLNIPLTLVNKGTVMKKLTLAIIASLGLLSNAPMANEIPKADATNYEILMQSLKTTCPSCEFALSSILEAMNQQCGFPITEENFRFVATSHPAYAFSMAANSLLKEDVKQRFNKALVNNINCWNADVWIESTKSAMSDDKFFNSIFTNSDNSYKSFSSIFNSSQG